MTDEEYNGWKNYDTWLLALDLDNEYEIYQKVLSWVKENPIGNFEFECEREDAFKEWLEDMFWLDKYNIVFICDSWTQRDWDNVDFKEVIKHFEEL